MSLQSAKPAQARQLADAIVRAKGTWLAIAVAVMWLLLFPPSFIGDFKYRVTIIIGVWGPIVLIVIPELVKSEIHLRAKVGLAAAAVALGGFLWIQISLPVSSWCCTTPEALEVYHTGGRKE